MHRHWATGHNEKCKRERENIRLNLTSSLSSVLPLNAKALNQKSKLFSKFLTYPIAMNEKK